MKGIRFLAGKDGILISNKNGDIQVQASFIARV